MHVDEGDDVEAGQLLAVTDKYFWEIVDRGVNFDYLEPERKQALEQFFSWFPATSEALATTSRPSA